MPFASGVLPWTRGTTTGGSSKGALRDHSRLTRSSVLVIAAALLAGPVGQTAAAPVLSPVSADDLDDLAEQAEEARDELEEATDAYTEREEELEAAQEELVSTLHSLQQTELRLGELREPLAELAATLYKQPEAGVVGVLTSESLGTDLEVESYVHKLAEDREAVLEEASGLHDDQGELTTSAQELQASTQLERVELEDELEELRNLSEESTEALYAELEARGMSVDAYMAGVDCDTSQVEAADNAPNGLIPEDALCDVGDGDLLRADAAIDFLALNQEYNEQFGEDICITAAYRDLPNQHRVYAERPGFAAIPGTSTHGRALALDLCNGLNNYRSEKWNWLETNGAPYGWIHPDWAKGSPFEPWHWEYEG
ncbi:M15 family metallopeptidase [Spiractinospora alimapuensis]|uniref:M15 family metallopeptidase n=1 Tax=Spiractinospora alimapuensis TaxID=2820884 RepID=UPI002ED22682